MIKSGAWWGLIAQRLYDIQDGGNKFELLHESFLEEDEDAPMTLAVHPEVRTRMGYFPPCVII